jgi:hypothetical protein
MKHSIGIMAVFRLVDDPESLLRFKEGQEQQVKTQSPIKTLPRALPGVNVRFSTDTGQKTDLSHRLELY